MPAGHSDPDGGWCSILVGNIVGCHATLPIRKTLLASDHEPGIMHLDEKACHVVTIIHYDGVIEGQTVNYILLYYYRLLSDRQSMI